jgi:hypothetical protein
MTKPPPKRRRRPPRRHAPVAPSPWTLDAVLFSLFPWSEASGPRRPPRPAPTVSGPAGP